ncbi:MAG: hypothetical protein B5M51_01555 [Anaerolinea sp. 4484_236]|nr:MAG: hypothetical protein B5M51_01555 [Anaerolinea sp. 4484_236]
MKKNHLLTGFSLLILVSLLLFPIAGVQAQEGGFTETFDEGPLNGWEHSEQAIVEDGVLSISPGHFAVKFGDYGDSSIELKTKFAGPGVMFVRFHMQEAGNYALIFFEDRIVLEKIEQDSPDELGVYERSGNVSEWMDIRITVNAGQLEVFLGNKSIIQATDPDPLTRGSIGFWVDGESVAEFDDLKVSDLTGGVFPPPAPATGGEGTPEALEPVPPGGEDTPESSEPIPLEEEGEPELSEPVPATASETSTDPVSPDNLISSLTSSQANPLELTTFVINLALSVLLSFILSRVYVHWGSSLSNRRRFAANFMLITVTTTFIILVVRSSVALSLGLVGALSIIRFRAAIKEPEELAYLFFAISIGIGLGDNQRLVTVFALAVAILTMGALRFFRGRQADFNLHVTVASHNPDKIELESIMDALSPHCSQIKLMRFDDSESTLESSFLVEFKNIGKLKDAKAALRGLSAPLEITFLDNKGIW